jgi:4-amino-4-deoxy-L-arabinose transferase-like glycosyltransferase
MSTSTLEATGFAAMGEVRAERTVLALVAAGAVVRLALAAAVPITVDEAYYVDWARHLQPGYLDHPPLVAWLIALPLRLAGPNTLAIRLPAVLLQAGTTLLAASLARALAGSRAAIAAALLLQAAPVFSLGATLVTPDAPLALAWAGVLWSVERAFRRGPRWFLAAGAFLGIGALSKLTAGLLGVSVLAALVATRDGRRALAGPWPWAGAAVALAVASPMLAWNAAHGWPSVTFQAAHGTRGGAFSVVRLLGAIGAQAAYVSPVILVLAALAAARALRARAPATFVLACSALPVVVFFTVAAAFTPGALPHWPAPGWLSATVLLAVAGTPLLRPALTVGFTLIAALLVLVLAPFPLPGGPLDELHGWREGAAAARAAAGGARLAVTHWIALGQLGWYDGASPAYLGDRRSGPSLYDPDPLAAGAPLLVVTVEGLGPGAPALAARIGPLRPAGEATATERGRVIRRYRFWWWEPPVR